MPGSIQPLKIIVPLGGAIVLTGIAGYVYYTLFHRNREIDEVTKEELQPNTEVPVTKVEVKIPKKAVALIIGRHGANIKQIEEKTSTSISFKGKNEGDEKTCIIKGEIEKIERARELILKAVEDIPTIESSQILVPNEAIGRIIGRNGETIHSIQRMTGAKISISNTHVMADESFGADMSESSRKMIINGTTEQTAAAKSKILEKVDEERELQQQIKHSASHISKRSKARLEPNGEVPMKEESVQIETASFPATGSSKTYSQVFVSAVASATQFWAQVVGPKTVELDKLVSEMTEYYDDCENRELHILDEIKVGGVVAARFPLDDMWYRGRVCCPPENESPGKHSVYFVDFGDTDDVEPSNICELRTDFLKLNFQAVECFLANIEPASANTQEAFEAFESLTYATKWKIVIVRVLGYKQDGTDVVPCVRVIDTSGHQDIDVAEELVKRGMATWCEEKFTSLSSSQASLTEGLSI